MLKNGQKYDISVLSLTKHKEKNMVRNFSDKVKKKNKDLLYTSVELGQDFGFAGAVVAEMKADKETAHFSPEYMNLSVNY